MTAGAAGLLLARLALTATPDGGIVLAYYPCWVGEEFPPAAIDFTPLTHVCHAFLAARKDGSLSFEGTVPSRDLTERAHRSGALVLLSLGGANSGRTFNVLGRSAAARRRYARGAAATATAYGYDGLDLDWEFAENAGDREALTRTARELRSALDRAGGGRHLLLTAALPNGDWFGRWYDAPALARLMDFFNVMTYDFAGSWGAVAGHNSPLRPSTRDPDRASSADTIEYWVKRGLPAGRLNLGLAAYARGFDAPAPYAKVSQGAKSKVGELDYHDLIPLLAAGWTRTVDGETGVPWLLAPDRTQVIGYDDAESLSAKTRWARTRRLGGVFIWDLNGDRMPDGSHPLIRAMAEAWRAP